MQETRHVGQNLPVDFVPIGINPFALVVLVLNQLEHGLSVKFGPVKWQVFAALLMNQAENCHEQRVGDQSLDVWVGVQNIMHIFSQFRVIGEPPSDESVNAVVVHRLGETARKCWLREGHLIVSGNSGRDDESASRVFVHKRRHVFDYGAPFRRGNLIQGV